jgi:uncharacterized protein YwgA
MYDYDKAIACLKALDFKVDVDRFDDRLMVQKIVFLLQLKGIKTKYSFGMHVRGPYSPYLTDSLYEHKKEFEHLESKSRLSTVEKDDLDEFKAIFGDNLKPGILEVASSYAYYAYGNERLNPLAATRKVKEVKSFCTETQIALGISLAKQFLFRPTKENMKSMKEEFAMWQNASLGSIGRSH